MYRPSFRVAHLFRPAWLGHQVLRCLAHARQAHGPEAEARLRGAGDDGATEPAPETPAGAVPGGAVRGDGQVDARVLPREHQVGHALRPGIERPHRVDPAAFRAIDEVVALAPGPGALAVQLHLPLSHGRGEFLECQAEAGGEDGTDVDGQDEAMEADPASLGRGEFRVPAEVPDGEDGGDEHRGRDDLEHLLRQQVEVSQRDASQRDPSIKQLPEVVRQVDHRRDQRKAQDGEQEEPEPVAQDIAIEQRAAHHAVFLRANRRRRPLKNSPNSPPRDEPPPLRWMATSPSSARVPSTILGDHMARAGGT